MNPKIVLGTFQNKNYKNLISVVDAAVECGCKAFDTAPSYGTEIDLGRAILQCMQKHQLCRKDIFISNKVDAWQMIRGKGDVRPFVLNAIEKMRMEYMDIMWVHWPIQEFIGATWRSLQWMQSEGLIKEIGICNVRVRHLFDMAAHGIETKHIQIERHPMRTCEKEMAYCKEHNIKVYDYSPICRMHPDLKNSRYLKQLAVKYRKNIGQIILRWHIETDAVPIFMSTKPDRVKENLDIFDFKLTVDEVKAINQMNQNYKIFLESWGCPGF